MGESGYYAPGTENSPLAPWNQREGKDCEDCRGEGDIDDPDGVFDKIVCPSCGGSGVEDPPTQEDIEEARGERRFDELHDEGRI